MNLSGNFIGIDVSKDTLDCCLLIQNEPYYHKFKNSSNGFEEILTIYHNFKVIALAFESTGNYHKKLEKYLFDNGVKPYILNPLTVSNFTKSLKIHGKTDKTDSYAIALFLLKGDLTEYLSYPIRETFKPITTSILNVDKQITQTKNLIHSLKLYPVNSPVLDDLKIMLESLKFTKKKIRKDGIELLFKLCPESKEIKKEIKGVGDNLLLFLIPYLYDHFDKFNLKQINAFFGFNPVSYESGTSVYKRDRLSKKGDTNIMTALYLSTISAIRTNEILGEKYEKMKARGKQPRVAQIAIMSHLLRAVVIKLSHKTGRPYRK